MEGNQEEKMGRDTLPDGLSRQYGSIGSRLNGEINGELVLQPRYCPVHGLIPFKAIVVRKGKNYKQYYCPESGCDKPLVKVEPCMCLKYPKEIKWENEKPFCQACGRQLEIITSTQEEG